MRARGCLLKGAHESEVAGAITVVANGEAICSPGIAQRMMRYFADTHPVLPRRYARS